MNEITIVKEQQKSSRQYSIYATTPKRGTEFVDTTSSLNLVLCVIDNYNRNDLPVFLQDGFGMDRPRVQVF